MENNFFTAYLFLRERETETETECEQGRDRERERERERIWSRLQALSCQHRAQSGARTHEPWDRDLSWSWTLNRLSHPGAPVMFIFKMSVIEYYFLKRFENNFTWSPTLFKTLFPSNFISNTINLLKFLPIWWACTFLNNFFMFI